jgi:hypothetical protein
MIELTRLQTIDFVFTNNSILADQDATQHLVSTLEQKKSSVQELLMFCCSPYLPQSSRDAALVRIKCILKRNQQLNRVALLLVPPPPPPPPLQRRQKQQQQKLQYATSIMLKISCKAITKFSTGGNSTNAGMSAIFKLLQGRRALLEKGVKRPATTATATTSSSSDAGCPDETAIGAAIKVVTTTVRHSGRLSKPAERFDDKTSQEHDEATRQRQLLLQQARMAADADESRPGRPRTKTTVPSRPNPTLWSMMLLLMTFRTVPQKNAA